MTIHGIGIDIVELTRFNLAIERQGQPFLDRCFAASEQEYCHRYRESGRHYAARFAAKEAVAKALGTGIGAELGWLDIEVRHKASGAPFIVLSGVGAETARCLGIREVLVSISHSEFYAVANAIAVGN